MWNTYTGNTNFSFGEIKTKVPDLLQPHRNYRCTFMALLFGSMPSWHSVPCDDGTYPIKGTLVCKTRVKATQRTTNYMISKYKYTKCHFDEIFVIDRCFVLRLAINVEYKTVLALQTQTPVATYFIHILSLMTRQALQVYKLILEKDPQTGTLNYCMITAVPHWSEFRYFRSVTIRRSTCAETNGTMLYVQSIDYRPLVSCGANQFQCDDGSCISHQLICDWSYDCSPSRCVCWVQEREVYDIGYCRNVCFPGKCSCSKHHFQCTTGGCIQLHFVCDGVINCHDASDEFCAVKRTSLVSAIKQSSTEVLINQKHICLGYLCTTGECIPLRYVNDLMSDCPNIYANDEYLFLGLRFKNERFVCKDPETIPCISGLPICFSLSNLCLYDLDEYGNTRWCRNGAHLGDCATINCTNSYKCPGSYCVPFHRVCDGHADCIEAEDEEQCDEYICKGFLRCAGSSICVHPNDVCDSIIHCPDGDDEMLGDVRGCPLGCNCLSYSIICTINLPNVFPLISGDYVKHLSMVNSYMPFPEVYNICEQNRLLILNLTKNEVRGICEALQKNCKFYDTLIVLDLAWNHVTSLQPFCFGRLVTISWISFAHNPLVSIGTHVFEHSLVSYIDIQGTELRTLSISSIQEMKNLRLCNIMDLQLFAIDVHADFHKGNDIDILFNDKRFCCIFTNDKHCRFINDLNQMCPTLLPHRMLSYMLAAAGTISVIVNVVAITANIKAYRGRKLSKLITFLCITDAALASYLSYLGIADIYYDSNFVFVAEQWKQSYMCHFMDVSTSSGTMISLCLSGLLVYLTSQGVVKIRFSIDDIWHQLSLAQVVAVSMISITNVSLVAVRVTINDVIPQCNMMANPPFISGSAIFYSVLMDALMITVLFVITFSAVRLIWHIVQTGKDVKTISGMNSCTLDKRKMVYKFMIAIVIVKSIIMLPYPFLQLLSLFGMNISEYAYQYATVAFITLESFYNPTVFVFRPLNTQKFVKIVRTQIEKGI